MSLTIYWQIYFGVTIGMTLIYITLTVVGLRIVKWGWVGILIMWLSTASHFVLHW